MLTRKYVCVNCREMYDPAKTLAMFKGTCGRRCEETLAKKLGLATKNGRTRRLEFIAKLRELRAATEGAEEVR